MNQHVHLLYALILLLAGAMLCYGWKLYWFRYSTFAGVASAIKVVFGVRIGPAEPDDCTFLQRVAVVQMRSFWV